MAAAPALIGGDVDLEEIGDIGRVRAEGAELAGLGGADQVVGGAFRDRRGRLRGRVGWRKFPVIGQITGNFLFFGG
jgi:hypothetical protein